MCITVRSSLAYNVVGRCIAIESGVHSTWRYGLPPPDTRFSAHRRISHVRLLIYQISQGLHHIPELLITHISEINHFHSSFWDTVLIEHYIWRSLCSNIIEGIFHTVRLLQGRLIGTNWIYNFSVLMNFLVSPSNLFSTHKVNIPGPF